MGDILDTIFGKPSKSKQTSSSSSSSESGNKAFEALMGAFGPAFGYTSGAGNMARDILGLGGGTTAAPAPTTGGGSTPVSPVSKVPYWKSKDGPFAGLIGDSGREGYTQTFGGGYEGDRISSSPRLTSTLTSPTSSTTGGSMSQSDALSKWADSAGMNFIMDQGVKALEGSQAGRGMLQSGATAKGLLKLGQNIGSTYLQQYMDNLFKQAGLGLEAGRLVSGAGAYSKGSSSGTGSGSSAGGKMGMLPMIAAAVAKKA